MLMLTLMVMVMMVVIVIFGAGIFTHAISIQEASGWEGRKQLGRGSPSPFASEI